ncbi:MAG: universal stress protein [Candidatus Marinimicrobia bacterium]|nr:universal stress protein [Candidatus Neomarinimicrobiota bacterium]
MFSKVLLATDLSKGSAEVARCVHGLKPLGTKEIILAECLKTLEAFSMAYSEDVEKFKASLIEQENIVKEQEFSVKSETVFGSVHAEIDRLIKKYDCNAVMVPSLGHTMLSDILLGNLASELINHITKPLLLVRLKVVDTNDEDKKTCILASSCENFIASILYATDFSEHADEAFLYLRKLVKSGAEEVTLLHVQDMVKLANESKENIKRFDAIDHGRLSKLRR